MERGVQSLTTTGATMKLPWFADNSDTAPVVGCSVYSYSFSVENSCCRPV